MGRGVVESGDRLRVARPGEELIDPETGISLGGTTTPVGELEITQVEDKFSIARIVEASSDPTRGDRVTSLAAPPSMEFADRFDPPGKR